MTEKPKFAEQAPFTAGSDSHSLNTQNAKKVYADIIDLSHHQSATRPHMSLHDRAAQFAPFAALSGYDDMVTAHLENVRFALDLACALDMPRLNMHLLPGTYSSVNGVKSYLYAYCRGRYLDCVRAFRDLVAARLRGRDTVFCLENTSGWLPFQHEAVEILLEAPCFGLTFDVGHDFRIGGRDEAFILSHQDRLRHFHIHDCDGRANHLALGDGRVDVPRFLRLADRLNATALIEVKESGALIRSAEYLRKNGFL